MTNYLDLLNSALVAETPPEAKNRVESPGTPLAEPVCKPRKPEAEVSLTGWLRGALFAIFIAAAIWNVFTPTATHATTTQASACPVPQETR